MKKINIQKKSTWFLILTIIFGFIAMFQINAAVKDAKQEIEVVQTTQDVPAYTVITKEMVKVSTVPKSSVVEGTFLKDDLDSVVGKITIIGILNKANVQKGHIFSQENGTLMSLLYSLKNKSLVSASIPLAANDIGTQINPGDTIHLNGVFNLIDNQVISKYVAEYVPVLGVDKKEDGTAKVYVAVKKEDYPDVGRSIDTGRIRAVIAQKEYEEEEKKKVPENVQQQVEQKGPASSSKQPVPNH